MSAKDPLEATLSALVRERLAAGNWTAIAMAGDQALTPIVAYLRETFEIAQTKGIAIIVVRHDV